MVELNIKIKYKTMANKTELVEKIATEVGVSKADAGRTIETLIESVHEALGRGEEVAIAGLGVFSSVTRGARKGRNPYTGATIQIAEKRVPKFRAAKALKEAVR